MLGPGMYLMESSHWTSRLLELLVQGQAVPP